MAFKKIGATLSITLLSICGYAQIPVNPNNGSSSGATFPATNGVVCNTSTLASTTCTSAQLQTVIGAGVYDASGAAAAIKAANVVTLVRTVATATDTATTTDGDIKCNATTAASTESLPATPYQGEEITYIKVDSSANACTLSGNGNSIRNGSTIATTYVLSTPGVVIVKYDSADTSAKWTAK